MAIKLTKTVKKAILDDKQLFIAISERLGIQVISLYSLLNKNSKTLARYDVAKMIAESLNIKIDELFEKEEAASLS